MLLLFCSQFNYQTQSALLATGIPRESMLKAIAPIQGEIFPFMFPDIAPSSHGEHKELILSHLMKDVCY